MTASETDGTILRLAPAKVNLFLEIPGKRSDGYHDIATLMLAVDLADELGFAERESGIELTCDAAGLSTGPDNLVRRAAELLQHETGCGNGAAIELKKRIPWAAGLGGGSSDAAATLQGLNDLWKLKLGLAELAELGGRLGSDVPFFLHGPSAFCTGRGEVVAPVAPGLQLHLLLVQPPSGCSTAEVYRRLHLPHSIRDGSAVADALKAGDRTVLIAGLFNRLEEPAFALNPEVRILSQGLKQTSALGVLMSGSGSSLFALAEDELHAAKIGRELDQLPTPPGTRRWLAKSLV